MTTALAFFRRDARIALSYPLGFWLPWISIVISVVGFHFVSQLVTPSAALGEHGQVSSYFPYVIVNVTFSVLLSSALQAFASIVRRDQITGTLEPILAVAPGVSGVIAASGIWTLTISALQVALYLVTASLLGLRLGGANLLCVVTFSVLGTACMATLGLIAAAAVIAFKQAPPSNFLIGGAASMLAGVLFPTTLLPWPLQIVAWCLPLTHALAGMRAGVAGLGVSAVAGDAAWLAVATLLLIPIAIFMLTAAIERAQRDGTLAYY